MKKNIIFNSHINFLINQLDLCEEIPNLKRKYSYTLGAIRSLFLSGSLSREDYFYYMKSARLSRNNKHYELMRPFWESLERGDYR